MNTTKEEKGKLAKTVMAKAIAIEKIWTMMKKTLAANPSDVELANAERIILRAACNARCESIKARKDFELA